MFNFGRKATGVGAGGSGSQAVATALRTATANTPAPLQPQELLFLMGAAVREPPVLAMLWAERTTELGKQADAILKMLTVLHRLQLHSPAFTATLLGSSIHSKPFDTALSELSQRFSSVSAAARGPFIRAYLAYLRQRMQAPAWANNGGGDNRGGRGGGGGGGGGGAGVVGDGALSVRAGHSLQRRMALEELLDELPQWESLFDAALDAYEKAAPAPLTHQV
jgi:uncharacterized membrane protein YgcG